MRLVTADMIPIIDKYAVNAMEIPEPELMGRAGDALLYAVEKYAPNARRVLIFAGKGNNGGDGYALAARLAPTRSVTVIDVFSTGQRSEGGKFWLAEAESVGARILPMPEKIDLEDFDLAVDAVFGTGFVGEYPESAVSVANLLNSSDIFKIAVDVPLGVNADNGSVEQFAIRADVTVMLSFAKVGELSYPAREYVGEVVIDDLGISDADFGLEFKNHLIDAPLAKELLPKRNNNTSKGNFGRVTLIVGSDKYRGAAHLALEGALRAGAGYVSFIGDGSLSAELRAKFPEVIYLPPDTDVTARTSDVILVGCGSGCTEELARLVETLITTVGAPLILDADAINAVAKYSSADVFLKKSRKIILTPHPLEFSRLSGFSVDYINAHRIECAKEFVAKYGVILLLKGAASVITDGEATFINSSGSSALAKAGSGDVLAGILSSLVAQCGDKALAMTALAAYLHGRAGDELEAELSAYSVTPSDIPAQVGKIIVRILK